MLAAEQQGEQHQQSLLPNCEKQNARCSINAGTREIGDTQFHAGTNDSDAHTCERVDPERAEATSLHSLRMRTDSSNHYNELQIRAPFYRLLYPAFLT